MNLPNRLTLFRIILVPFIIYYLNIGDRNIALFLFLVASITDFLDGYISRKYNMVTNLGAFLDPMADKVLILSVFIEFVALDEIAAWIVSIVVSREMIVSILRAIAGNKGIVISAGKFGKLKTVLQMVTIIFMLSSHLLIKYEFGNLLSNIILILQYVMMIVTLFSGIEYIFINKEVFEE